MCENPFTDAVKRGIALLNSQFPYWRAQVDWTDFSMSNPEKCVLGYIFGRFAVGVSHFGFDDWDVRLYGFDTKGDYALLTAAWKELANV